jgi:hypothetical protein
MEKNKKYQVIKTPLQSPKIEIKKETTTPMEEEINTKIDLKKKTIKEDEKEIDSEDELDIKKDEIKDNKNTFNLVADEEKELLRINLKKNIVVRILDINDEKYVDFCKYYKGYPTKKNIRIKYKTYLKIKDLLILN